MRLALVAPLLALALALPPAAASAGGCWSPASSRVFCPGCVAELSRGRQNCPGCGAPAAPVFAAFDEAVRERPEPEPREDPRPAPPPARPASPRLRTLLERGDAALEEGDATAAVNFARACLALAPDWAEPYRVLAGAALLSGDPAAASRAAGEFGKRAPGDPRLEELALRIERALPRR